VLERLTALSHYDAEAFAPSEAPDSEERTRILMVPFERDLDVPHTYYSELDEVQGMAKRYGVSPTDLEAIYAHWRLEDLSEHAHPGLDKHGLFWFDTQHPQGRWTAWSMDERFESVAAMKALGVLAFVIITQEWVGHGRPVNQAAERLSRYPWIA